MGAKGSVEAAKISAQNWNNMEVRMICKIILYYLYNTIYPPLVRYIYIYYYRIVCIKLFNVLFTHIISPV